MDSLYVSSFVFGAVAGICARIGVGYLKNTPIDWPRPIELMAIEYCIHYLIFNRAQTQHVFYRLPN